MKGAAFKGLIIIPICLVLFPVDFFSQTSHSPIGTIWLSDSYFMNELHSPGGSESSFASIPIQAAAQFDSISMQLVIFNQEGIDTTLTLNWSWENDSIIDFQNLPKHQRVFKGIYTDSDLTIIQTFKDSFEYVLTMRPYDPVMVLVPDKTYLEGILSLHSWHMAQNKSSSSGIMQFRNDGVFEYLDQKIDANKQKPFLGNWKILELWGIWFVSLDWHTNLVPSPLQFLVVDHLDEYEINGILWDGEELYDYKLRSL